MVVYLIFASTHIYFCLINLFSFDNFFYLKTFLKEFFEKGVKDKVLNIELIPKQSLPNQNILYYVFDVRHLIQIQREIT